jgi:glycosyltransferase involved in cell wall biosynthesis
MNKKTKNILIVSLWPISKNSIGGTEKYVLDLATGLAKNGCSVTVLMMSGKKYESNGVRFVPLDIDSNRIKIDEYSIKKVFFHRFDKSALEKFAKTINDRFDFGKYDLVHFNSLLFFCVDTGRGKRVFTLHENPMEFAQNWGKGSLKTIISIINKDKRKSYFIAPSLFYKNVFSNKIFAPVDVIPHSINFDFLKKHGNRKKLLKKFGLSENKFTILFPNRLELVQKRPQLGLRAIKKIKKYVQPAQIVLSGVDDQYQGNKDYLKKIMSGTDIDLNFINFPIDKMGDAYEIADLVMLPSRYESFGYAAAESLAIGKKTVLSNIPTFRELSTRNSCAFVSKINTSSEIANTILKAIRSKRKTSVKKWVKKYDRDRWIKKYINFYETIR